MKKLLLSLLSLLLFTTGCESDHNQSSNPKNKEHPMSSTPINNQESIIVGMGCFWGAEKRMAAIPGVINAESGYAGGDDTNAGYYDVLGLEKDIKQGKSQKINHAEVVKVTFDPSQVDLKTVLIAFWESHNPTEGNRQGNDIGTNYRSVIYTNSAEQMKIALETKAEYQPALTAAKLGSITTEIAPLHNYIPAEDYHQDYLKKNPNGYCGLGGTGVAYPGHTLLHPKSTAAPLQGKALNFDLQLVMYEADNCGYCKIFDADIANDWQAPTPLIQTKSTLAPEGWQLKSALFATPTIVLFRKGQEVDRFTGYNGKPKEFWQWLGKHVLDKEQSQIAFQESTEMAGTGAFLHEKRNGDFIDPITGKVLFKSNTKYESGSGWPSFTDVPEGAVTLHTDTSHGMKRVEVRSASSGIHLGHLFEDGPAPTGQRYCINGNVLSFQTKAP